MTVSELARLSEVDIETVEQNALAQIEDVTIDTSLPAIKRMMDYLDQVKNPYCFMCGTTPVKICFSPEGNDLGGKVKAYFLGLKR